MLPFPDAPCGNHPESERSAPIASGLRRADRSKRRPSLFSPRREATCRICFESDSVLNLCAPCGCRGDMQYVHPECCQRWIMQDRCRKADRCEVCRQEWAPECGFQVPEPNLPSPGAVEARAFEVLWSAWLALEQGLLSRGQWDILVSSGAALLGPWSPWVARRRGLQKSRLGGLYLRLERACHPRVGAGAGPGRAARGRGAAGHAAEVRSLWLKACHGLATVEEHRRLVEEGSRVDGPWSAYVLRRHRRRRSVVGRFLLRMEEESIAWRLSEPPLPSPRAPAL